MQTPGMPPEIRAIFNADPRVACVTHALDGFVPNSYHYRAPGTRRRWQRDGSFTTEKYDRKRSYGRGTAIVAWSAKGGCL
jgi:hypothetical protein